MKLTLRPGRSSDAQPCGEICFNAFSTISARHNFPPDFPSVEVATGLIGWLLSLPYVYSVVAEVDGQVAGSNFLWEGDTIAGIGPITVHPSHQNSGAGRGLMESVLTRAVERKFPGVRLVQAAFHNRSLSLYTKLGFEVREPLANMQGQPLKKSLAGCPVRPANEADVEKCSQLCQRIHGHDRRNELLGAIQQKTATVVERNGSITGYATAIGFFGHAVAESNDDLKALIAAAPEFSGPGFLLPARNSEVFRWCLNEGLRVVQPMNLMSRGLYNEPRGAFLPSILY
jgi:GNAT superfamily N-acetyltransferase